MYRFNVDANVNSLKLTCIKVLTTLADSGYHNFKRTFSLAWEKLGLSGGILRYVNGAFLPLRTNLYLVPMFQNCAARTTMLDMVIEKPSKLCVLVKDTKQLVRITMIS